MLSWRQLVQLPPSELAKQDIAEMNLACHEDLPLTESLNIGQLQDRLDYFVRTVQTFTKWNWRKFKRRRYDYHNSPEFFLILALVEALQRYCSVNYNPLKIDEDAEFDAADSFIFGILRCRGGTCATIPVVCVAVGRRLGYPLHLVNAYGGPKGTHCFSRWDDGKIRFNIEATAKGIHCPTDDYYRKGRYAATTPRIERDGNFLRPLNARQEMALFMLERAFCWKSVGCHMQAAEAITWASGLYPENLLFAETKKRMLNAWDDANRKRLPPRFPILHLPMNIKRFPKSISKKDELDLLGMEAVEHLLNDPNHDRNWWEPLRKGLSPMTAPDEGFVNHDGRYCQITLRTKPTSSQGAVYV